ncbi:MAG: o-succinylbenzoate synthase [Opitutaceae bacterium]
MRYLFQFRRYHLPFRTIVRTAHGPWGEREGIIVRLQNESGGVGFGEAAVIPWFGTETAEEAEAACRELGGKVDDERLATVPTGLVCLRNALAASRTVLPEETERKNLNSGGRPPCALLTPVKTNPALGMAALLPAGRAAITEISPKLEAGFRVFKWKVGVGDPADELGLLDDVCAALPSGAKLRLDANGAWERRQATRWMERCAERPVEFVEQPIAADARGAQDVLLGLAGDYPTPIALDESLVSEGDLERWIGAGWPGVFVVKPSLLGDVGSALARLAACDADVVFSSALETAIGARAALQVAFAWTREREKGKREPTSMDLNQAPTTKESPAPKTTAERRPPRALGFGVWPLFSDARFDGQYLAPFIRWEDVERINPEDVWNALS